MNLVYKRKLDINNRVVIPAELRHHLGSEFVGSYDSSGSCLYLYSIEKYEKIIHNLQNSQHNDMGSRYQLRSLCLSSLKYVTDERGRIKLAEFHKQKANIEADVYFRLDFRTNIVEVSSS